MINFDPKNKNSILHFAKKLEGRTLREVLSKDSVQKMEEMQINSFERKKNNTRSINKGGFGQKVEKYYFGYENNSSKEADFSECNLELKITPLRVLKNGELRPKERMVCNIINFHKIVNEKWDKSSFLKKCNEVLIIRYVDPTPDKTISHLDYKFVDIRIHNILKSKHVKKFESDWNIIVEKIKAGLAHELSESDTTVLGACTKGANNKSLRSQPNSNTLAMQRAFTFKQQYMKILLDEAPEIHNVWSN